MKNIAILIVLLSQALPTYASLNIISEKSCPIEFTIFEELNTELKYEIVSHTINDYIDNFMITRDFKQLSDDIAKLRLANKELNEIVSNIFTPKFIDNLTKKINNNSEFPIFKIALANSLLTKGDFETFIANYNWNDANKLGLELIDNIRTQPINIDNIKNLIQKGANIDVQGLVSSQTALIDAINKDYTDISNILIKAGANLEIQDDWGYNALMLAVMRNNEDIVDTLINLGVNLDKQNTIAGLSALMLAVLDNRDINIINKLIKAGAKLDLKGNDNETALIMASFHKEAHFVAVLVEAELM